MMFYLVLFIFILAYYLILRAKFNKLDLLRFQLSGCGIGILLILISSIIDRGMEVFALFLAPAFSVTLMAFTAKKAKVENKNTKSFRLTR